MDHADKQELIGRALSYEPPPRLSFGDWWEEVDRELKAAGQAIALHGEVGWRWRDRTHLSARAAALEIIAERLARQAPT